MSCNGARLNLNNFLPIASALFCSAIDLIVLAAFSEAMYLSARGLRLRGALGIAATIVLTLHN